MLKQYSNIQLKQIEEMNKQIEARVSRRHSINLRNEWMHAKTVKNYQSEYDRIRNHLEHSTTPGITREQVIKRKKNFRKSRGKSVRYYCLKTQ